MAPTVPAEWATRRCSLGLARSTRYGGAPMSIRIEIELTSSAPDGSWTWRAAGAREPRGVLDGSILPAGSKVGDQLRVETEKDMEGTRVLSVVAAKEKGDRRDLLELLPSEERFEPVVQHRAPGRTWRRPTRPAPRSSRRRRAGRPARPTTPTRPRAATGRATVATAGRATGRSDAVARDPRARTAAGAGRTSRRRPRCRSVPSPSASARASNTAPTCWRPRPRSSARSPSWRCRAWPPCASACARTTSASRPRASRRCRSPR